jgi:large repetitive protein
MTRSACFTSAVLFALANAHAVPGYFIENKGQLSGDIAWYSKNKTCNIFFRNSGFTVQLLRYGSNRVSSEINKVHVQNVGVTFVGGSGLTSPRGEVPTDGRVNFLLGSDSSRWVRNLDCFSRIRYAGVYPHIDFVYQFNSGSPEYDIVINPGGDINEVALEYAGVKRLEITREGNLKLVTDLGVIVERIPESYQIVEGRKVLLMVRYKMLGGKRVGFTCENFRKGYPVVVDPTLVFSTFLGGSGEEFVCGTTKKDASGNIYLCGYGTSTNYPTQSGSYDLTYNGGLYDAVVTKLSNNGANLIYSTYIGGNNEDGFAGMYVKQSTSEVYVAGVFRQFKFSGYHGRVPGHVWRFS